MDFEHFRDAFFKNVKNFRNFCMVEGNSFLLNEPYDHHKTKNPSLPYFQLENVPVITMSLDQMAALLEDRNQIRVLMIAPTADGNPRRGCEDPNCPAVKGQDVQILTPDTFAKQPMT